MEKEKVHLTHEDLIRIDEKELSSEEIFKHNFLIIKNKFNNLWHNLSDL